jgi:SAM-dependent methyltransferase
MNLLSNLSERLLDPRIRGLDPDDDDILEVQASMLAEKKSAARVFSAIYRRCLQEEQRYAAADGMRLELGSGTGFVKHIDARIVTTDVRSGSGIDKYLDAMKMDLPAASLRMLLGLNVFHHIQDPARFLDETRRVLKPGGVLILVEPWYGPVASLLYRYLFSEEDFDKKADSWTATRAAGPMKGANQALSYIVFQRDAQRFQSGWPELKPVHHDVFANYPSYLLSGGINFRQLVPGFTFGLIHGLEYLLYPLRRIFGLHQILVFRKEDQTTATSPVLQ